MLDWLDLSLASGGILSLCFLVNRDFCILLSSSIWTVSWYERQIQCFPRARLSPRTQKSVDTDPILLLLVLTFVTVEVSLRHSGRSRRLYYFQFSEDNSKHKVCTSVWQEKNGLFRIEMSYSRSLHSMKFLGSNLS